MRERRRGNPAGELTREAKREAKRETKRLQTLRETCEGVPDPHREAMEEVLGLVGYRGEPLKWKDGRWDVPAAFFGALANVMLQDLMNSQNTEENLKDLWDETVPGEDFETYMEELEDRRLMKAVDGWHQSKSEQEWKGFPLGEPER